jgi:hypothetical protein
MTKLTVAFAILLKRLKSFFYFEGGYGPVVDSSSNRNEYQMYFLGVKAAGA